MKSAEKLTLFKALRYAGFEPLGDRIIGRGNVRLSFRMGYEPHYYLTTPLGIKDYDSQRRTLHALIGFRLINKTDIEKMVDLGYVHAQQELSVYDKTIANYAKRMSFKEKNNSTTKEASYYCK